ncbi:MAG: hypothetical protein QM578_09395 [Pantoea sp.]|uniref:hypothetical protein n=1 Tax=Pantoea sp. TaxID=69393 RepID=UPI0039E5FF85
MNEELDGFDDPEIQVHIRKELIRRNTDVYLESFRSAIRHGENVCKALMLVNGGASVALLAFLGNVIKEFKNPETLHLLGNSMMSFGLGVVLSVFCAGTTYFSQGNFTNHAATGEESHLKRGKNWTLVAILCGLFSAISFIFGLYFAFQSLQAQFPLPIAK